MLLPVFKPTLTIDGGGRLAARAPRHELDPAVRLDVQDDVRRVLRQRLAQHQARFCERMSVLETRHVSHDVGVPVNRLADISEGVRI